MRKVSAWQVTLWAEKRGFRPPALLQEEQHNRGLPADEALRCQEKSQWKRRVEEEREQKLVSCFYISDDITVEGVKREFPGGAHKVQSQPGRAEQAFLHTAQCHIIHIYITSE